MKICDFKAKFKTIHQYHARLRSLARNSIEISPCAKCGYSLHVEVCHIISVKDFDDQKTVSELNSPENLVCLCPNCHWEHDNLGKKTKKIKEKPTNGNKNKSRLYPERRKVSRPPLEELELMVANMGYEATGRQLGVSGGSIRKWILLYKKYT